MLRPPPIKLAATTILAVAAAIMAPCLGYCHTIPVNTAELVTLAHDIVVARVLDRQVHWNEQHNLIVTDYRLAVERRLKGSAADDLTISMAGGTIGAVTHDTCLTTPLVTGGRYVLFLHDPKSSAFNPLVGAYQGFVREGPDSLNGEASATGPSPALSLDGGAPVAFREFVERLAAFAGGLNEHPIALPRRLLPQAKRVPGLPFKIFVPEQYLSPAPDTLPVSSPARPQAPQPASRVLVHGSAAAEPRPIPQRLEFHYTRKQDAPIVVNQLLSSFGPWSPEDQYMMSSWNFHAGDLFRVLVTPTGTYGRDDSRNDICGFLDNTQLNATFGRTWAPLEIGLTFRTIDGSRVIEADIAFNAGYAWTVNDETATDAASPEQGFRQTALHELGHAWGLNHPWEYQDVWWDSAMNYAPNRDRLPVLWADDTLAVRTGYGGVPRHDESLSLWTTSDDPASTSAQYLQNGVIPLGIFQGGDFALTQPYKIENVGTIPVANPRVDVFLTPERMSWDGGIYTETLVEPLTINSGEIAYPQPTPVTIPLTTPPGLHFVVFSLADPFDEGADGNTCWTDDGTRLMVNSLDWWLTPASFWQSFEAAIAPSGTWVFRFNAVPWASYDFSVCLSDGGAANFFSVLRVLEPGGALLAEAAENCGTLSRIAGFIPPFPGPYAVRLLGEFGSSRGPFTLRHRKTGLGPVLLFVNKLPQSGVELTWQGNQPSYDVERATRADFLDGVFLQQGWQATTYDDPDFAQGPIRFYRVQ